MKATNSRHGDIFNTIMMNFESQIFQPENQENKVEERVENAKKLFDAFLGLGEGQRVLFLTDTKKFNTDRELIEKLTEAVSQKGEAVELVGNSKLSKKALWEAVQACDVIWISWDMDKTNIDFYELADFVKETGKRMVFSPGVRVDSLENDGALAESKEDMEHRLERMEHRLQNARGLRVTSSYGTNLQIGLKTGERRWFKETGAVEKGGWGNLPGGELFTTPDEEDVNGVLVLPVLQDEVTSDQGVDEFVWLTIRNGKIAKIDGKKSADTLRAYIEESSKDEVQDPTSVLQCAEIAFGANAKARPVVSNPEGTYTDVTHPTTETEKRLGTMHLAFGSSKHGEEGTEGHTETESGMHLDFVLPRNGLTVVSYETSEDYRNGTNGKRLIDNGGWNFL